MKIKNEIRQGINIISLNGRLDSFSSQEIGEKFDSFINSGSYKFIIDFSDLNYLSSAGIRILLQLKKSCTKLNGDVKLTNVSPYVLNVLKISGFLNIFSVYENVDIALKSYFIENNSEKNDSNTQELYETSIGTFKFEKKNTETAKIRVIGENQDFLYAKCKKDSIYSESLNKLKYTLGIGALGDKPDDFFANIGELMIVGGTVVWVPTDGHNVPDFLIPIDESAEIKVHTAFHIILENTFNEIVRFEAKSPSEGVSLEDVYKSLFELSKGRITEYKGILSAVMRVDVGAIFGAGIKKAPILKNSPANSEMITHRDNIKDWLNFQVDYEHQNTTALIVGIGIDLKSYEKSPAINLVFQINPDQKKQQMLHNHAAIFKFFPEKYQSYELEQEIDNVINNGEFIGMQHLLDRSTIKKGIIGLNYVQEIKKRKLEIGIRT
ncbi:MAG: STAS domain-containing protein [Candidatus Cloacimonetes bacterium]|nr:STAS domain-containing protein [Candidatus Cloacimonadota bacterium]